MEQYTDLDTICLLTDSYKLCHWNMLLPKTEKSIAYFESRAGALYPETEFVGLQPIMQTYLAGKVVTREGIEFAASLCALHLGDEKYFNRAGWEYILDNHDGKLPLRIKAVPEGKLIPTGNVLMTVENTDPKCAWLTNFVETILTHVWFPCTVGTRSYNIKKIIEKVGKRTGTDFIDFHLHDFGFRGTSSRESAAIGGMAHLVNFLGTDTLPGIICAYKYYKGELSKIGFSVPATEHGISSPYGADENTYIQDLCGKYPDGILSMVGDTNNIIKFVDVFVRNNKDLILNRWENGKGLLNRFVVRPDSPRWKGDTAWEQVVWLHECLAEIFGFTTNEKGYKVLHPAVGVIYGDGLSIGEIEEIYVELAENGWDICNCVVGQGGGLLQKLNRDTQRFAFKCCAQLRDGTWYKVSKNPLDNTKGSKAGRMKLVKMQKNFDNIENWEYKTVTESHPLFHDMKDELVTVFLNGEMMKTYTFDEVRANAREQNHN